MTRYRRRNKLPKPSVQLRLTLTFMGTLLLSILMQSMLMRTHLMRIAAELPNDGPIVLQEINRTQISILLACLLVLLPLCFVVGVLSTFRLAGPLYRFEEHLRRLVRGEDPGPCRIRTGDQLQEFCDLLNVAIEPVRKLNAQSLAAAAKEPDPPSLVRAACDSEERMQEDAEC